MLQVLMPSELRLQQSYNMMFDASGENEQEFIGALQSRLQADFTEVSFQNADLTRQTIPTLTEDFCYRIAVEPAVHDLPDSGIYYKQITEGYSDRYNYEVMQKVGLDKKKCRRWFISRYG